MNFKNGNKLVEFYYWNWGSMKVLLMFTATRRVFSLKRNLVTNLRYRGLIVVVFSFEGRNLADRSNQTTGHSILL